VRATSQLAVAAAFLPLLRLSDAPRIVNVSSSAGSLTKTSDFANADLIALGYVPSKTALTSLTIQYARGLASEKILVKRCLPGFRRDRSERLPWCPQHQRGRCAGRTDGDHPRRRADRHLHR
jgi:NAD(P)-dependent dehydrogenase (short-subunit alcohol dehydrogenase family)